MELNIKIETDEDNFDRTYTICTILDYFKKCIPFKAEPVEDEEN